MTRPARRGLYPSGKVNFRERRGRLRERFFLLGRIQGRLGKQARWDGKVIEFEFDELGRFGAAKEFVLQFERPKPEEGGAGCTLAITYAEFSASTRTGLIGLDPRQTLHTNVDCDCDSYSLPRYRLRHRQEHGTRLQRWLRRVLSAPLTPPSVGLSRDSNLACMLVEKTTRTERRPEPSTQVE